MLPAPDPRAALRMPRSRIICGDVADGEEVRRVAERADDLELVVEPLPDALAGTVAVAPADALLAADPQGVVGGRRSLGGDLELREVHLPDAEVGAGVEDALVGEGAGLREQVEGAPVARALQPGEAADLLGDLVHLLAGLQEPLGVAPVEVAQVHRHQPPGRIEHVGRRGVEPVGEADRVGEHDRDPGLRAERARPAIRAACGEDPGPDPGSRWETTSTISCPGPTRSSHRASTSRPRSSRRSVAARPSSEAGPSSTRTSRPATCSATSSGVHTGVPRSPAAWVAETSRHTAAQPLRPLARKVTRGSRGSREAPPRVGVRDRPSLAARSRVAESTSEGQVDAEDRPHLAGHRGLGEPDRAVGAVAVGQGEGVHLLLGGSFDEDVGVRGAVLQGVAGGDVEVDERVGQRSARPSGHAEREVLGQPEGGLHQREEPVGVTHQVVGLPLGDRPARARLGRGPLGGAGRRRRPPTRRAPGPPRPAAPRRSSAGWRRGGVAGWARAASSAAVARSAETWAWA